MEIIITKGYSFNYRTSGGDVGGFANINNPDGLIVSIKEIGGSNQVCVKINGIYIQIWCKSYEVKSIRGEKS